MNLKSLIVGVVALAAVSLTVYFVRRPDAPAVLDPRVGHPLLPSAVLESATKFVLKDEGKTVELNRLPSGAWQVTNFFDLPADFQKLARFTGELSDATVTRLVTTNPERLSRLEFKGTTVELQDPAGHPLWTLSLGKSPDLGGRFVRFDPEQKAYLANLNSYLDADPKNWADTQLVSLKAEDVSKISIPTLAGPVVLARAKPDAPWTSSDLPAGQQVAAGKMSALLGSLGNLHFSEAGDPSAPEVAEAKAGAQSYILTTFAGKSVSIELGRRPEQRKLKEPGPGTSGPAALGSALAAQPNEKDPKAAGAPAVTPLTPEFETVPAGPVFAWVLNSGETDAARAARERRAYQIPEYAFTALPQKPADLFEPISPPAKPSPPAPSQPSPPSSRPSSTPPAAQPPAKP